MSTADSSYITLSQVAVRTGRHPELLRQWCASGRLPCRRLGGSWVMLERDVGLIDGIASRARRPRAGAATGTVDGARIIAAVFDDGAAAERAAGVARQRLGEAALAVETAPFALPAFPVLSLTVVAGRVAATSAIDMRRILGAFGGRVVSDRAEGAAGDDTAESRPLFVRP